MDEIETLDMISIPAPKLTTSWPITRGAIEDTLTCESSISAVDSETDVVIRKPPLILHRTSPDSSPCEITILFSQKHEIKQVYVRSTSRVYEIYYAVDERGDNEYLCTVRCGVAARIEETAEEIDGAVSLSTSLDSSNRSSCEGYIRSESGGSSNEDGWVDIKMQNTSVLGAKDSCLSKKDDSCLEQSIQDYFEATAEIADADPVLSVTIRLLSVQSGDYIYIDEIYVFADPVVEADTKYSTVTCESSSESATMSLLIPTLLQMSKYRRNQSEEHRHSSVGLGRNQDARTESVSAASISNTSKSESTQDTKVDGASAPIHQSDFPVQRLDSQSNSYFTSEKNFCSRVEGTLDELVSRVAKIEHFCLRFEENMLKPISNMEARLERVEKQLESFGKTATLPMAACTRISAPVFSDNSESNSIFTAENHSSSAINSEFVKKGLGCRHDISVTHLNAYSSFGFQTNDVSSSCTDVTQLLPSLVITAPDFSSVDDEEENGIIEATKDSPKGSSKKPVSIDDALASALSGLLLSASIDIGADEETANASCEEETGCQPELDGNVSVKDVAVEEESLGTDSGVSGAIESVDEHRPVYEESDTENSSGNSGSFVENFDLVRKDTNELNMDIRSSSVDDESNQTFIFGSSDSAADDTSMSASGIQADSIEFSTGEETAEESSRVLMNILEFQKPVLVDFSIPILDVEFSSRESLTANSSLDTLLSDVPGLSTEVICVEEDSSTSFNEQSDLVMIDNVDSESSLTPDDRLLCLENNDSVCMPLNRYEEQQKCSIQDMGASLI